MELNSIFHYGVKGMKWGVRRSQAQLDRAAGRRATRTKSGSNELEVSQDGKSLMTSNGSGISLKERAPSKLIAAAAKLSPALANQVAKSKVLTIHAEGEEVGGITLMEDSPESMNVVVISVDKKHQGNGYGTAVMQSTVDYAKASGKKEVTLEVPGTSKAARHIYEKMGFEAVGELGESDDIKDQLTAMRLDLTK